MCETRGRKKDRRGRRIRRRVERMIGLTVEVIHGLDRLRRIALQATTLWTATRATIVLMAVLARLNRWAEVRAVMEDLQRAARRSGGERAVVFVVDRVFQALRQRDDLQAATVEALAWLRRLAVPPAVEEGEEEPEARLETQPAPGPFLLWLKLKRFVSATEWESLEIKVRHTQPFGVTVRLPLATLTLYGEAPGTRPGAAAPILITSSVA